MKHVMLDLETWGTRPGCAIRSVGACLFDPTAPDILQFMDHLFYENVTDDSCRKMKLYFDKDTVKWWSEQEARASEVFTDNPKHLKTVVTLFNEWFRSHGKDVCVWGHGASFDPPVYDAACVAVGFKVPWSYRGIRDTRTLFDLVGLSTNDVPFLGIQHNALDDAVHQAKCVQAAMRKLNVWKEQSEEYDGIKGMYGP